mmetsp:Transcript_20229/g.59149  ORF Transcript_20229/g.59149 Transcript_20229/m.59149 type:complete len:233 (-) Transcript_20229:277-975(-)
MPIHDRSANSSLDSQTPRMQNGHSCSSMTLVTGTRAISTPSTTTGTRTQAEAPGSLNGLFGSSPALAQMPRTRVLLRSELLPDTCRLSALPRTPLSSHSWLRSSHMTASSSQSSGWTGSSPTLRGEVQDYCLPSWIPSLACPRCSPWCSGGGRQRWERLSPSTGATRTPWARRGSNQIATARSCSTSTNLKVAAGRRRSPTPTRTRLCSQMALSWLEMVACNTKAFLSVHRG